jgi:nucleotide-binding universal stress UspA family protein
MEDRVKRIVVPVNGQRCDERAIRVAAQIADRKAIGLTLIHVVEVRQFLPLDAELPAEVERGEAILRGSEEFADSLLTGKGVAVESELLQARSAGTAIVDEAIDRESDLIIMATRLRTRHGKVGIGETTKYVLQSAPCEVMILRQAGVQTAEESLLAIAGASTTGGKGGR